MRIFLAISLAIVLAGVGYMLLQNRSDTADIVAGNSVVGGPLADVVLPDEYSEAAKIGKQAFNAKCADCHGVNAQGQRGVAPPLVHVIYEPGHHGDESFQRAVSMGVRAHHWPFGNMPPVDGMTRADVAMIVAYIRELQRANGIN